MELPWNISVDRPAYLGLLLMIPLLWWWSRQSLSGLGARRGGWVLFLRSVVLLLLVLALADTQLLKTSPRLCVIFLLDQSASIPVEDRRKMVTYVVEQVAEHRRSSRGDLAGVITFGRAPRIEVPPIDDDLPLFERLEAAGQITSDATDLEAALRLAQATFPEQAARRIVIVSDGNENLGNVRSLARQLADDGVGIDAVPVQLAGTSDVAVDRILLPSDLRQGQPFEARVVLSRDLISGESSAPRKGILRLVRKQSGVEQTLNEQAVALPAGKTVYRFRDELTQPNYYEYRAEFVPDDPTTDRHSKNNRGTAYTHLRGKGSILLIEDAENRDPNGQGEFALLASRLRNLNIEVTEQFSDALFSSLGELQQYDCVILANAARSSLAEGDTATSFSDAQIEMLVQNTQQLGCGLIMLGGPNAFGAGGWASTALEKAMPVDFQIRNAKVQAVGALAMVMHASEMAQGNHWQKIIAREALKVLGPQDYCGVIRWDDMQGREGWLWGRSSGGIIRIGSGKARMVSMLGSMRPGDMPAFEPALKMAAVAFSRIPQAAVKHMIVISDGDPSPPTAFGALAQLKRMKIKVSTVAVGTHGPAGSTPLRRIAVQTGGKYYVAKSARALPRIFQREARRVARPLVVERTLQPRRQSAHEILRGIDSTPPLNGFVLTSVKLNPLVEVPLLSPIPEDPANATLLAAWTYGLGRAAVFTSDAGARWAKEWADWELYDKFFGQLVRWCMRPTADSQDISVSTQHRDGKVLVAVDVLREDRVPDLSMMSGTVVRPDMQSESLVLRRVSPTRYVAETDASEAGSYFVSVRPSLSTSPVRVGLSVPYSPEYRDRETNRALLEFLAALPSQGGVAGELVPGWVAPDGARPTPTWDPFRHNLAKAKSSDYVWPWLLWLASTVFLADIVSRKVAIAPERIRQAWTQWWIRWRRDDVAEALREPLERLRASKAEVAQELEQRQAAGHFEPSPEELRSADLPTPAAASPPGPASGVIPPQLAPGPQEEESFTSRLLRAKKDAHKDQPPNPPLPKDAP